MNATNTGTPTSMPDEAPLASVQPTGITLQAIGLTLGGGLCVSFLTVVAFGVAVMLRHTNVAPRCTTRHPNTIWRSRRDMYGESTKNKSKRDKHDNPRKSKVDTTHTSRRGNGKNAATMATELSTGLGITGSSVGQKKEGEEEHEQRQRRQFVHNSTGKKSWVGADPQACEQNISSLSGCTTGLSTGSDRDTHVFSDSSSSVGGLSVDPGFTNGSTSAALEPASSNTIVNEEDDFGVKIDGDDPELYAHPQDRGNPFLGWIPWTLNLSYDRMLRGIPGTGSRDKGMGGKLLGVNLDAIVLFRFHALCLRVTAVVCFICIGIILPLNITACEGSHCHANLTDYGRTTIANIVHNIKGESSLGRNTDRQKLNVFSALFWTDQSPSHLSDLLRLYAISICTWYITYFTLKNIMRDWRENLVLRRVYYLEADHYGNRQSQLDETVCRPYTDDEESEPEEEVKHERMKGKSKHREPWLTHPEHRETVPNIELYSVLVGGLPSLPDEVANSKDMQTALGSSKRASIDWQLAVATTFFDHCVPNQPGFSSSVVAVTILPGAPELAKAWRKWYAAARALRKLRFIRQVINHKRYYDIDDVDEEYGVTSSNFKSPSAREAMQSNYFPETQPQSKSRVTFLDDHESSSWPDDDVETRHQVSQCGTAHDVDEYSSDVDYQIFRSLNYGPEQQAVYSREMAQGAAACCPNGCCEGRVKRQPIDRLLEMEDVTIIRLEKAQRELQFAQMQAAVSIVDGGDKTGKKQPKEGNSVVTEHVTEHVLQRNNFVGEGSSLKHRISLGRKEPGTSSHSKGFTVATSENTFRKSTNATSSIRNVSPGSHVFFPQDSSDQHNDDNFVKKFSPISGSDCEKPHVEGQSPRGTASPLYVEGLVGHKTTWEDQDFNPHVASAQSNTFFHNLSVDGSLAPKSNCRKSALNMKPPTPPNARSSILRMTPEGRFLFNNSRISEEGELVPPTKPPLRRRANTVQSAVSEGNVSKSSEQWNQVNSILRTSEGDDLRVSSSSRNKRNIQTGVWQKPSVTSFMAAVKFDVLSSLTAVGRWTKGKTDPLTSKLAKDSTYAVVTFSSRQAAVAARHCLADGRGVQRWLSVETVPVPPLADAAPCDIITCRGCCRPVTLNINHNQLMLRRCIALASLAFIYVFYTIPITAAQSLVAPQSLKETLPRLHEWMSQTKYLSAEIMAGLVSALLYTSFFAVCPAMFKAISNSGSQATSFQEAEKCALQYYWYFMLVTAFVFTGLADGALNIWWNLSFRNVEQSIEELMESIAAQIPLTTAATWLNWIIVRTTMALPLQYLLQVNSFIFGWIGWKCCARCVMGGGPGGPIPYRIYIDGGVVFLCVVALAPQSPLVAPVSLLYYLFCVPLWRRNCIFMYRPKFDSGGERWPFLSDMLITSLFMGQLLLTLQMVLKDAFGPALFAALPALPTFLYRQYLTKRFRKAYDDAGLLQTSLLDGWDNTIPTSVEKREEFRQFLIDAHKAAYIPVCIAGGATNILTAEPAVVIPSENDDMLGYADLDTSGPSAALEDDYLSPCFGDNAPILPSANVKLSDINGVSTPTLSNQPGACMRRAPSFSARTPRSTSSAT